MDWVSLILPGVTGLVGGLVGTGILYITNRAKIKADGENIVKTIEKDYQLQEKNRDKEIELISLNLEAANDKDLRVRRIDAYTELWGIIPDWYEQNGFENHLKNGSLPSFRKKLLDWYSKGGGLVLTDSSNAAFLKITEDLRQFIFDYEEAEANDGMDSGQIHNLSIFETTKKQLEDLRIEVVKDIGTRKNISLPVNP